MFSLPIPARLPVVLATLALTACVGVADRSEQPAPTPVFYTVTAEIALSRHEPRIAALEYAAAAEIARDPGLLRHAAEVAEECLQPSLTADIAARWTEIDPAAADAHRAAAMAALDLHKIDRSAAEYRAVIAASPRGTEVELAALATALAAATNVYGARQLADRLADDYPHSSAALRMRAFAALRADDPVAATRAFEAALANAAVESAAAARQELVQGLRRARILAGDVDEPLAQARDSLERDDSAENRLDYALMLLAAQQDAAARAQLAALVDDAGSRAVAVRLLGLVEFQDGQWDEAAKRFAELVAAGKFVDDALYYLGLIAERRQDTDSALRLYAEVRGGENAVPALLRAAAILRTQGAEPRAEEMLDDLTDEEPQRAPEILAARARIYADGGDVPRAIATLEGAELEYPDSVELRYALAALVEQDGRVSSALRDLAAVAAARPTDPAALNAYGYTLADHHRRLATARQLIERAYAAAPANAAIRDSMGWVLFRQGHANEALPYLRAAYDSDRDGDVAAHLGEVLWRLGRHGEAEQVWSEGNRAGTDNRLLKATRLRLRAAN